MPPTPDLSFTSLDEFVNKPVVKNRKSDEEVSEIARKNDDAPIIKEWVSNREEENVSQPKTEKKTVKPSIAKIEFVKPKQQEKTVPGKFDNDVGKFDGKADEGFFVGYSLNSKALRVFNSKTRIVEENLHIRFSESTPNAVGSGPYWLFDIDALTRTMNYELISNGFADYILLPLWTADPPFSQDPKSSHNDGSKPTSNDGKKVNEDPRKDSKSNDQEKEDNVNNTNNVNAASTNEVIVVCGKTSIELPKDPGYASFGDY
ncbi:hypothetical protein Tco_0510571 [Tanacetum coccineum]